jgi:hypothetical protein
MILEGGKMIEVEKMKTGSWFEGLFLEVFHALTPNTEEIQVEGSPEEMTRKASRSAFLLSTGAGMPMGPIGLATIVPELIGLIKIQINLIYRIAKYYNQEAKVSATLVLFILGNALGVVLKHAITEKIGVQIAARSLSAEGTKKLTKKIGEKIGVEIFQRAAGRWIPFVLAPVFGYFSLSMTRRVGREAEKLLSQVIEISASEPQPAT